MTAPLTDSRSGSAAEQPGYSARLRDDWRPIKQALHLIRNCKTILVAPSHEGELSVLLGAEGFNVTGVERREKAVAVARELAAASPRARVGFQVGNVERMSFADRHFDAVLCAHLLPQLLDQKARASVVAELCRVASRFVLITYLDRHSLSGLLSLASELRRGPGKRPASISQRALSALFAACGFKPLKELSRSALIHGRRLAVFQRQ